VVIKAAVPAAVLIIMYRNIYLLNLVSNYFCNKYFIRETCKLSEKPMRNIIIVTVMFVVVVSALTTGCLSTTQNEAQMKRQLQRQSRYGEGKIFIEGHNEYVKKREWVDTSKKERVWVDQRVEGDKRIDGHYEERFVTSGNWQEYEEKTWIPGHYE
jgi:hypothetical protein